MYQGYRGNNFRGRRSQKYRGAPYSENVGKNGRSIEHQDERSEQSRNEGQGICFIGEGGALDTEQNKVGELNFFMDSGCTYQMVNNKKYVHDYIELKTSIPNAAVKNNYFIYAEDIGNIKAVGYVKNKKIVCNNTSVLYIPCLRKNLLSVTNLEITGYSILFENAIVKIKGKNNDITGIGYRDNLYEISGSNQLDCLWSQRNDNKTLIWHKRLSHISHTGLRKLIKWNLVDGVDKGLKIDDVEFCEACVNVKMCRLPYKTRVLEIVHSDVCRLPSCI